MAKEIDAGSVGQDKPAKTPNDADESANGSYADNVGGGTMKQGTDSEKVPFSIKG
jgi:hypothetical protein